MGYGRPVLERDGYLDLLVDKALHPNVEAEAEHAITAHLARFADIYEATPLTEVIWGR